MITTKNFILRAPFESDYSELIDLRNDLETQMILMALPKPYDLFSIKKWVAEIQDNDRSLVFVIADKTTNSFLGFIKIDNISLLHRICELGICFKNQYRNKGFFKECMMGIEYYLTNVINIRKIVVFVRSDNVISLKAFNKISYVKVGVLKQHFYCKRKYIDVEIMERLLD